MPQDGFETFAQWTKALWIRTQFKMTTEKDIRIGEKKGKRTFFMTFHEISQ